MKLIKMRILPLLIGLFGTFTIHTGIFLEESAAQNKSGLKFEISFPAKAHPEPITGRVYAIISKNKNRELRFQTGFTGVPIWGMNIYSLEAGKAAVIDEDAFGYPLKSIKDIPPGEYYVQGFINIYTEFKRSDGHTLWMHNDQWEGQRWNISPGNIYSDIKKVYIDPSAEKTVTISCDNVIPPVKVPHDTKWVKRIKFESKILTEFWGQPIYLGATVLLPKGYDTHPDVYYPVNYAQGHFSLRAPHGFRTDDPERAYPLCGRTFQDNPETVCPGSYRGIDRGMDITLSANISSRFLRGNLVSLSRSGRLSVL